MLDLSISTRLADETEPVTSKPTMGTLLQLERFFNLPSAIEALQQTKSSMWRGWRGNHAGTLGSLCRPGKSSETRLSTSSSTAKTTPL